MKKKYQALVLSCIDPRFQTTVFNYLKKRKLNGRYSSFTIAVSAIGVTAPKIRKWHKTFWDNLETSIIDKIGLNVKIKNSKNNKGHIIFEYKSLDQLNKIIEIIKANY